MKQGYIEGRNVTLVVHWSGDDFGGFPDLAADWSGVRRWASVIAARTPGARAAQAATATIPIVFMMGVRREVISSCEATRIVFGCHGLALGDMKKTGSAQGRVASSQRIHRRQRITSSLVGWSSKGTR